ncbi:MAG: hypothetical protein PHN75_00835 [Syntrophales bacterium]|nr:hypothetical protein [Syntrophales bacterium]
MKKAGICVLMNSIMVACLVFFQVASVALAASDARSLREFLVASKNVAEVHPIDDSLTFVIPEKNMITSGIKGDFDEEFFSYCREKGAIEVQSSVADPLTGKQSSSWLPLKLDEKERFAHPLTGEAEKFGLNMLYQGIAVKGASSMPLRIKDYMEVVEVFKSDRDIPRSFIVKTKAPQPFIYKIKSIPVYDKIVMPPDGELVKNVSEIKNSRSGGLFKAVPLQRDADIFVYLTALCLKNKLTPKYLINEGEFVPVPDSYLKYFINGAWQGGYFKVKLKEIAPALEMFKFMADLGADKNKFAVWYFAGQGDKKFVSRGSEERMVDAKGTVTVRPQIVFANNRGLEGIEFSPLAKKEEPAPAAVLPKPVTDAAPKATPAVADTAVESGKPVPPAAPPKTEAAPKAAPAAKDAAVSTGEAAGKVPSAVPSQPAPSPQPEVKK